MLEFDRFIKTAFQEQSINHCVNNPAIDVTHPLHQKGTTSPS